MAIAHEIEAERTHHRLNNIKTSSGGGNEKARIHEEGRASSVKRKRKGGASQMTKKHGFLDVIKLAGKGEGKKDKSVRWSALKDDFMMNSKLKDWDKKLYDDGDDDKEEQNEKSLPARNELRHRPCHS
eukprot:CCRYP_020422-RA/>CCRYP_020422-RA protein AED:0.46 eAED:0.60 QI:0/0/0/0.75/0.66/0.5/4/0/127